MTIDEVACVGVGGFDPGSAGKSLFLNSNCTTCLLRGQSGALL